MSGSAARASRIEGRIWPRIDFEEGGRYLDTPRRRVVPAPQLPHCPENRVRYTTIPC